MTTLGLDHSVQSRSSEPDTNQEWCERLSSTGAVQSTGNHQIKNVIAAATRLRSHLPLSEHIGLFFFKQTTANEITPFHVNPPVGERASRRGHRTSLSGFRYCRGERSHRFSLQTSHTVGRRLCGEQPSTTGAPRLLDMMSG